jgi:hypothetical protein
MSNFALITSAGLNSIVEATSNGTLISCRYFIPVYDYRIDTSIDPTDTAYDNTDITTVANEAETLPDGEIIWNTGDSLYSLSTDSFIISAGDMGAAGSDPTVYVNGKQRSIQPINMYDGQILSNHISGTAFVAPSGTDTNWIVYDADEIEGLNDKTFNVSKLFNNINYAAVGVSGENKASFICKVTEDIGTFKFNKLGIYAVKLAANYEETGEPFLFAQVILPYAQIKSGLATGGVTESLIEFQLDFQSTSADFSSIVYGTSADYWEKRSEDGGMLTQENVYIVNTTSTDDVGVGKLFISTQYNIQGTLSAAERDIPQVILQHIDNSGSEVIKKRATLQVIDTGDLSISLSASNVGGSKIFIKNASVTPTTNGLYNLGAPLSAWANGYYSEHIYVSSGWNANTSGVDIGINGVKAYYTDISVIDTNSSVRDSFFIGNVANNQKNLVIKNSGFDNGVYIGAGMRAGTNVAKNADFITRVGLARNVGAVAWGDLDSAYELSIVDTTGNPVAWDTDCGGDIYLIAPAGNIWNAGNIVPLKPATYDIGSQTKWYNTIFVNSLANYSFDNDGVVYANSITLKDGIGIIPENNETGDIGSASKKFNAVYSKSANISTITASTITATNINFNSTWTTIDEGSRVAMYAFGLCRKVDTSGYKSGILHHAKSNNRSSFINSSNWSLSRIVYSDVSAFNDAGGIFIPRIKYCQIGKIVYFNMYIVLRCPFDIDDGILINRCFNNINGSLTSRMPFPLIYNDSFYTGSNLGNCTVSFRLYDSSNIDDPTLNPDMSFIILNSPRIYAEDLNGEVIFWNNEASTFENSMFIRLKGTTRDLNIVPTIYNFNSSSNYRYLISVEGYYQTI